jgi:D-alanine--poly(phosphoribitol) ligase subunit 2
MTNVQETVLTILEEICGTDAVREDLNLPLFDEGLLDSFGSVALLVEIESQLGITVGISDFDRDQWATPQLILERLAEHQ